MRFQRRFTPSKPRRVVENPSSSTTLIGRESPLSSALAESDVLIQLLLTPVVLLVPVLVLVPVPEESNTERRDDEVHEKA